MAPKAKKGEKGKGGAEDAKEERLQAVILADSFETKFNPFALEHPRCLLPLANTPLIDYSLEFLASNGVQDVWIYCGAHTEQVEEHILKSKYNKQPTSPFSSLTIIRGGEARSIGDAMRDLDKRRELEGDFIVIHGDLVSNVSLQGALEAHKKRRETDKNAIMTMVLRAQNPSHTPQRAAIEPVFVVDPTKDRCLHYEEMSATTSGKGERVIRLEPDLLTDHSELDVLTGIIDTGIDICTPDALALWSDNFDFETPRRNFLYQVLKDYELNGKTIHTYVVEAQDGYARRVRDLRCYDQVSKDVVSRLAYPLVPDANFEPGRTSRVRRGNAYVEEGVILARSCVVGKDSVVGEKTSIGDNTRIVNSVIGKGCIIGRNVTLDGAYLWDHAVVGSGSTVKGAIVANEASVGKNCVLEPGALVSYGVKIAEGVTVRGSSRVTRKRRDKIYPEPIKGDPDPQVVGKSGDGFEFVDSDEDDEEGYSNANSLVYNSASLNISSESISTLGSSSDFEDDYIIAPRGDSSHRGSFISIMSDDDSTAGDASQRAAASDFHHDAATSLFDSLQKGDETANMQLELSALRMTANASEHQVRRAVVAAFMKHAANLVESGSSPRSAVHEALSEHGSMIGRTMFDKDMSEKTDQVDFLMLMQSDLSHRKNGEDLLLWSCYELYNEMDIIEQDGLEQWWEDERGKTEGDMLKVRAKMGDFMERLMEEEESSEEEEEEEDDDDDDDD